MWPLVDLSKLTAAAALHRERLDGRDEDANWLADDAAAAAAATGFK